MGRKSSIQELEPKIREAVDSAIRDGRASIDDIVELIDDMGGEASRSAVGRYRKNAVDQMRRWQEAREISKVWVGKLEEDPSSDVGRLISEMLKTVAFQTVGGMVDGGDVEADQGFLQFDVDVRNGFLDALAHPGVSAIAKLNGFMDTR